MILLNSNTIVSSNFYKKKKYSKGLETLRTILYEPMIVFQRKIKILIFMYYLCNINLYCQSIKNYHSYNFLRLLL